MKMQLLIYKSYDFGVGYDYIVSTIGKKINAFSTL